MKSISHHLVVIFALVLPMACAADPTEHPDFDYELLEIEEEAGLDTGFDPELALELSLDGENSDGYELAAPPFVTFDEMTVLPCPEDEVCADEGWVVWDEDAEEDDAEEDDDEEASLDGDLLVQS